MGYLLSNDQFGEAMRQLGKTYRIFAPVCKKGEGRFKDVDLVRYDFVSDASEIELTVESDYAFKEFMLPLSETLFFFTENQVKEADIDERPVIVFLRSCDMHAVKRLDHMYLENGSEEDWFYRRRRDLVKDAAKALMTVSAWTWGRTGLRTDTCSPLMKVKACSAAIRRILPLRKLLQKQEARKRMWSRGV